MPQAPGKIRRSDFIWRYIAENNPAEGITRQGEDIRPIIQKGQIQPFHVSRAKENAEQSSNRPAQWSGFWHL